MLQECEFKIQILDDDPHVTEALALAFELDTRFPTLTANRSDVALGQLENERIYFQIVDYRMPDLDGLAYLRRSKQIRPDAFRTLLTGQAGLDNVIQLVNEVGLYFYFSKPVDNQQIVSVAQQAYRSSCLHMENEAIKETFRSYLPPAILGSVLERRTELLRGGTYDLTILFTDIRGFTAYAEKEEPVSLLRDLNRHLEYMCEAVLGHGGMVDKFIGDGVMAMFGGPLAPQDRDKETRAFLCALDMLDLQARYNAQRSRDFGAAPLDIGIGIASGKVTLGNIGYPKKYDFTAIGRTVNRAGKLVQRAPAAHVWLDHETFLRLVPELQQKMRPVVVPAPPELGGKASILAQMGDLYSYSREDEPHPDPTKA
jgi:class 3 adenylate cyclase